MVSQDIREVKIGNVALCSANKLGVVYRSVRNTTQCVITYFGIALDGTSWQSTSPKYVAESVNHYMQKLRQEEAKQA